MSEAEFVDFVGNLIASIYQMGLTNAEVTAALVNERREALAAAKRERDEARIALSAAFQRIATIITERDDAIRETASCADELAFWKYQAIWQRAFYLSGSDPTHLLFDNSPEWKEAERQLEETRVEENQHRYGAT